MLATVDEYIAVNLVHSIHVSERKSFRGCRRRWYWVYRDLYYPMTTAKPLEFGIAFHKAMEHWFDPNTWGIDNESRELETLRVFLLECERQKKEYYRKLSKESFEELDPEIEADYQERVELGQGMLRQMFKVSYEIDKDYRPVGVEVPFEVPITADGEQIWCKCARCWKRWITSKLGAEHHDQMQEHYTTAPSSKYFEQYYKASWKGLPVTLGGRIDCLFLDVWGNYWVVDWKTAARLSTGEPGSDDSFLWLDDQITSYVLALWILGLPVKGFIYHEIKKTVPSEPEPLTRRYKGCLYSQNKQADYDYQTYLTTVELNDPEAFHSGLYDGYLQHLKENSSGSYKRHIVTRNHDELRQAMHSLAQEALDMTDPNLRVYHNPGRFHCDGCAFREPCLGTNRGEDVEFTLQSLFEKRTKLYYEEEPSNTDKPGRG